MKIPAQLLSTSGVLIFLLLISSSSLLADPPKEEKHPPHLPPPAPMGTVQVSSQVGQTTDDVLEDKGDGSQYVFTADMVLAEDGSDDKWNGMRFDGMNVPQGATIQSAYIQFGVSGSSSGTANLKIWGEMSTDAAEFLWTSYGVANRSKTSDSVAWSPPNWPTTGVQGTDQQTPDLSDLVQEIVDQSGWVSGNAMAMFVEGTGTRWAHAYEGSSTLAPILYVTYQTTGNPPSAVASANPISGTAPLSVSFTGSNSTDDGSISSYAWDFGDGNSSTSADPSHSYTTTGAFAVSLIVTDNEGDKDTASLSIIVSSGTSLPSAVASASPTSGTASLSVSFTGSNSTDNGTITAYDWDFGDGNSSTSADPSHTYTTAGNFTAQLIVTDNQYNKDTATVAITVSSAGDDPIAVAAATPQQGTASLSVSFTGSNSTDDGSISAYTWDFGDSNSSSNADPSHTYTTAGLYVVQLIVTDNDSNSDTTELVVSVDSGSGLTQVNSQPGQTTDDVLEDKGDGSQYVFTSELVLAQDGSDAKWNGMRFDGVNVPQGATIQSAYIQFTVSGTSSGTANLKVWGEMSTDADEFLWTGYDIANRSKTTDSVAWSPPDWTTVGAQGADQQTPDLSNLIQEIVDQSGWVSGNAMGLFVEGTGTRWAEAYEGSSTLSPKLYIAYQNGVPPVAVASASPLSGIAPMTVSFTGSNSTDDGTITAYAWQFGDGKTSSSADPTHTYTKEGSYSAILSTLDNVGLVDRDTVAIQVFKDASACTSNALIDSLLDFPYISGSGIFCDTIPRTGMQYAVVPGSGNIAMAWVSNTDTVRLYFALFDSSFALIPAPGGYTWPIEIAQESSVSKLNIEVDPTGSNIAIAWINKTPGFTAQHRVMDNQGAPLSAYQAGPLQLNSGSIAYTYLDYFDITFGSTTELYFSVQSVGTNSSTSFPYVLNKVDVSTGIVSISGDAQSYVPAGQNITWRNMHQIEYDPSLGLVILQYVLYYDPSDSSYYSDSEIEVWDSSLTQRNTYSLTGGKEAGFQKIDSWMSIDSGKILASWIKKPYSGAWNDYTNPWGNTSPKSLEARICELDSGQIVDLLPITVIDSFSASDSVYYTRTDLDLSNSAMILGHSQYAQAFTSRTVQQFRLALDSVSNTYSLSAYPAQRLYTQPMDLGVGRKFYGEYVWWDREDWNIFLSPDGDSYYAGNSTRYSSRGSDWVLARGEYRPVYSHAILDWQQHGNLYPTVGDAFYVQYPSRKVPENIAFSFYDDATKTWGAIQAIPENTDVGPNKYRLDVTGLTYGKTYLMSVTNSEGEEEYFRIWKRKP